MEGEGRVTGSIIDELRSSGYGQTEGESGVTRSIIDECHFGEIEADQIERERGVNESEIDEIHC